MIDLNEFAKEVHNNAVEHGWWEDDRGFGEVIALCHSELSEALEEYRNGKPFVYYSCSRNYDGQDLAEFIEHLRKYNAIKVTTDNPKDCEAYERGKPEGLAVELADCIIRILDYCGKEGIDIEAILKEKHEYNKSRPYKHGGKRI